MKSSPPERILLALSVILTSPIPAKRIFFLSEILRFETIEAISVNKPLPMPSDDTLSQLLKFSSFEY